VVNHVFEAGQSAVAGIGEWWWLHRELQRRRRRRPAPSVEKWLATAARLGHLPFAEFLRFNPNTSSCSTSATRRQPRMPPVRAILPPLLRRRHGELSKSKCSGPVRLYRGVGEFWGWHTENSAREWSQCLLLISRNHHSPWSQTYSIVLSSDWADIIHYFCIFGGVEKQGR
jgi:hypothetical protein